MITWPRIQTVLVVICSCLLLSHFWSQFCFIPDADGVREGVRFIDKPQYLIFTLVTFVVSIAIIAYRRARILQVRLCIMEILMLLGYQGWIAVDFFTLKKQFNPVFTIATIFPLVCVILLLISIRHIWRDEAAAMLGDARRKAAKHSRKKKSVSLP